MSADLLRRAASLMRERAEAVDYPSPWGIGRGTCEIRSNGRRNYVGSTYGGIGREEAAAQHIASWHPAVALAVADWLDSAAAHDAAELCICDQMHHALKIARAFLQEDA